MNSGLRLNYLIMQGQEIKSAGEGGIDYLRFLQVSVKPTVSDFSQCLRGLSSTFATSATVLFAVFPEKWYQSVSVDPPQVTQLLVSQVYLWAANDSQGDVIRTIGGREVLPGIDAQSIYRGEGSAKRTGGQDNERVPYGRNEAVN